MEQRLQVRAKTAAPFFRITAPGKLTTLHAFVHTDGGSPFGALTEGSGGNLYGTTQVGGAHGVGTVFEITTAGKLTTIYSFCAQTGCADGKNPQGGVVQATDGNFYGTTANGGAKGWGTVFEVTPVVC
jgi:uncharacterized repeat protein (TIGR03803 family)